MSICIKFIYLIIYISILFTFNSIFKYSLAESIKIYSYEKGNFIRLLLSNLVLLGVVLVKKLKNYVVIRTRFFNKKNIRFNTAATDIFTSMIEVQNLVKAIKTIHVKDFTGVINVGSKKESDFKNYKKFKKNIKPCKRKDIIKNLNFRIAKDASMNLSLFKKIQRYCSL